MHISDFLFTSNYDPLIQNNLGFINLEKKTSIVYYKYNLGTFKRCTTVKLLKYDNNYYLIKRSKHCLNQLSDTKGDFQSHFSHSKSVIRQSSENHRQSFLC